MATVEQQWKGIKKAFETAAKKKRPSEKTLLVFNKPSGLTPASAELDKAIAAGQVATMAKALSKLRATAKAYLATIQKSVAAEKDAAAQGLMKTMSTDIEAMIDAAHDAAKQVAQIERCKTAADLLVLMKDKNKGPQLMAFAKKARADSEVEFTLQMAVGKHTQAVYDTFLVARAPKWVDVESDVLEGFETSIGAGNIGNAPWDKATSWILDTVNNDVIAKYNADAAKALG